MKKIQYTEFINFRISEVVRINNNIYVYINKK